MMTSEQMCKSLSEIGLAGGIVLRQYKAHKLIN